jgi:hypothetical protein
MASLIRGEESFTTDIAGPRADIAGPREGPAGVAAAKDDTTDIAGPREVKAAFRASVMGGGKFSSSEMATKNRMRGRRNSLSVLEGASAFPMWKSHKSLDLFLADAQKDSMKPKPLIRDARSWPSCYGPFRRSVRGTRSAQRPLWPRQPGVKSIDVVGWQRGSTLLGDQLLIPLGERQYDVVASRRKRPFQCALFALPPLPLPPRPIILSGGVPGLEGWL